MPDDWYEAIEKPGWNPPDAVFGPVWTILYVMMAVAAVLVWRRAGFSEAWPALTLFAVHLGVNAVWPYLFFTLHRIDLALIDIVVLLVMIAVLVVLFWGHDRLAGALLVPYLAWVAFATALNVAIWRLNPAPPA